MSELRTHEVPDAVDPEEWTLRVTGAVKRSLRFDREELEALPMETVREDFECEEGWVATDLSWSGVRAGTLLSRAEPTVADGYVLVRAMDGDYACAVPGERAAEAVLALTLDGDPLPVEHGGPARFVPTGSDADCWESVKWVSELEVTDAEPDADDTAKEIALGRIE